VSGVQLPAEQYISYGQGGETIASRSVRAWTLSPRSEMGPGIVVHLREPESFDDGIGVELTITDEQLVALGYTKIEPLTAALQAMADSIFEPLPFDFEAIEEMIEEEEEEVSNAAEIPSMLDLLGVSLEAYQAGVKELLGADDAHMDPAFHKFTWPCAVVDQIREAVKEKQRQQSSMLERLGGITLDTYLRALRRINIPQGDLHDDPMIHSKSQSYRCLLLPELRIAVSAIVGEELQGKHVGCILCEGR
jgi:hypothetical protein